MQNGDYNRGLAVLTGRRSPPPRQRILVGQIPERASPVPGAAIPTEGNRRWGAFRPGHQSWNPLHAGVDLAAPDGTAVLAPENGTILAVATANAPPWTGYAPCVFMAGESGRFHLLAHLSGGIQVQEGQSVVLGQTLGTIGPPEHHTHWEVRTRDHRAAHEPAIANSLSPSEWLLNRDVPIADATVPTEEVATLPVPSAHGPAQSRVVVQHRQHATPGERVISGLAIGIAGGLITWLITRD